MNIKLKAAALEIAEQFDECVRARGNVRDSFIDPMSKKKVPNSVTIHVTKLRALSEAVKEDDTFTTSEINLLRTMVADRLSNINTHLRGLEYSAAHESETARLAPRVKELTELREKLRAMQG